MNRKSQIHPLAPTITSAINIIKPSVGIDSIVGLDKNIPKAVNIVIKIEIAPIVLADVNESSILDIIVYSG